MSNNRKADSYRQLLKWTIVLFVLTAIFLTAYILVDKYQKGEHERAALEVQKLNQQKIEEYNKQREALQASLETGEVKTWPEAKESGWDVIDISDFPVQSASEETVTRQDLLKGGLLLVNRWHSMPSDFTLVEEDLASIGTSTSFRVGVTNASVKVFPEVIKSLDSLVGDAKAQGIEHYIVREGYRDAAAQLKLWETEMARHTDRYSGDALIERTRRAVSYPGTSDYHTGLSVNLNVYDKNDPALNNTKFMETAQGTWLNENCWKYGFVFRFPVQGYPTPTTVDKSFKTGIDLQINAYRYVGVAHAAAMKALDMCLEEYIDYLVAHPHIAVYEDGVLKHEIYRIQGGNQDSTITLPRGYASYVASSDNMDGLVVAISY